MNSRFVFPSCGRQPTKLPMSSSLNTPLSKEQLWRKKWHFNRCKVLRHSALIKIVLRDYYVFDHSCLSPSQTASFPAQPFLSHTLHKQAPPAFAFLSLHHKSSLKFQIILCRYMFRKIKCKTWFSTIK